MRSFKYKTNSSLAVDELVDIWEVGGSPVTLHVQGHVKVKVSTGRVQRWIRARARAGQSPGEERILDSIKDLVKCLLTSWAELADHVFSYLLS